MFGGGPKPPPPPPPGANPATFASAQGGAPSVTPPGAFGGLGESILTSPLGVPASGTVQRKTLLGQ